ncbi:hypothetical protein Tco_0720532 [Tanacetum coccineum]
MSNDDDTSDDDERLDDDVYVDNCVDIEEDEGEIDLDISKIVDISLREKLVRKGGGEPSFFRMILDSNWYRRVPGLGEDTTLMMLYPDDSMILP